VKPFRIGLSYRLLPESTAPFSGPFLHRQFFGSTTNEVRVPTLIAMNAIHERQLGERQISVYRRKPGLTPCG